LPVQGQATHCTEWFRARPLRPMDNAQHPGDICFVQQVGSTTGAPDHQENQPPQKQPEDRPERTEGGTATRISPRIAPCRSPLSTRPESQKSLVLCGDCASANQRRLNQTSTPPKSSATADAPLICPPETPAIAASDGPWRAAEQPDRPKTSPPRRVTPPRPADKPDYCFLLLGC
jgi:hypothetical protein